MLDGGVLKDPEMEPKHSNIVSPFVSCHVAISLTVVLSCERSTTLCGMPSMATGLCSTVS